MMMVKTVIPIDEYGITVYAVNPAITRAEAEGLHGNEGIAALDALNEISTTTETSAAILVAVWGGGEQVGAITHEMVEREGGVGAFGREVARVAESLVADAVARVRRENMRRRMYAEIADYWQTD